MLLARHGCRFGTLTPGLIHLLAVLEEYARYHSVTILLLSGTDSAHRSDTGHHDGRALDLRCHELDTTAEKRRFLAAILARLGPHFAGHIEHAGLTNEHFHLQVLRSYKPHPIIAEGDATRFAPRISQ